MKSVSVTEAARLLGKSSRQVRYMIQQGELPATKAAGRWVVDAADLPLSPERRSRVTTNLERADHVVQDAMRPARAAVGGDVVPDAPAPAGSAPDAAATTAGTATTGTATTAGPASPARGRARKSFSVAELDVFQVAVQVLAELRANDRAPGAAERLNAGLLALTEGVHAFQPADKIARLARARDAIAQAAGTLHLEAALTRPANDVATAREAKSPSDIDPQAPTESDVERPNEVGAALARRLEAEVLPRLGRLIAGSERKARRTRFARWLSDVNT